MSDRIPYREIVSRLADHAEQIATDCIPNGRREGVYWKGDCHGKISVHIAGPKVGMVGGWQGQFGDHVGANLIGLIELAMGFQSHGEAVRYAKSKYLGIDREELTDEQKRQFAKARAESDRKAAERERRAMIDARKRSEDIHHIWKGTSPVAETLAETYLNSRGLDLLESGLGTWPPSLRFHPQLRLNGKDCPALVGGVQGPDRKLTGIWRIFLDKDGNALTDAEFKKIKLGLGPTSGGAVRLGPVGDRLVVAEGIETALGVQRLLKFPSVWATLSTSGMSSLIIPEGVKRLEIYGDGDRYRPIAGSGKAGQPPGARAAQKLKSRAEKQGVETSIFLSPAPDDWLDVYVFKKKMESGDV